MASSGSPYGWSRYKTWLTCGLRASLDWEARERQAELGLDEALEDDALGVGTLLHKMLELYYGRAEATEAPVAAPEALAEATRLYTAYIEDPLRADLGAVLGVEKTLPCEPNEPDFELRVAALATQLALPVKLTCRSDLVVRLSQDDCDRIYKAREAEVTPGIWIVDHKTASRRSNDAELIWRTDTQMALNFVLWNNSQPEPCQGVLVNVIYKYKVPKFETFVVKPGADEVLAALHAVRLAGGLSQHRDLAKVPNTAACFNYFRPCQYLVQGCKRY